VGGGVFAVIAAGKAVTGVLAAAGAGKYIMIAGGVLLSVTGLCATAKAT
jgi:hypothetical protein